MKHLNCKRVLLILDLFLIFGLTSGCLHLATSLGLVPKKPDISLADIQVKSVSFTRIDVEVLLAVLNQDIKDLQIDTLNFDLMMADTKLGSGSNAEKILIKSQAEQKIKIPLTLQTKELIDVAADFVNGNALKKIRIRGSATVGTWAGVIPVPFDSVVGK